MRSGHIEDKLTWLLAIIACPFAALAMPREDEDE